MSDERAFDDSVLDGEQRWIVVSPFAISWVKACEAVSRLFGVWPPTAEIVRVVRPDLVHGKVYVLDREAILAAHVVAELA